MITSDNKMQPENKLFATLDVTYHGTSLSESNQNVIFIDTIGKSNYNLNLLFFCI